MLNTRLANDIVRIHLSGWRYIMALTLPPLVLLYYFSNIYTIVIIGLLFLMTHYYCWRLWLDTQLFSLLNRENSMAEFDEVMTVLWPKTYRAGRTLPQRWLGARRLFRHAVCSLILLWGCSFSLLLICG